MEVNARQVQELRAKTGAGIMDCKRALAEEAGNLEKAIEFLRKKGLSAASKKAGRTASEGAVGSYIHAGWQNWRDVRNQLRDRLRGSQRGFPAFCT